MARFTSIGMPKKSFVASAAEEASSSHAPAEPGPSTADSTSAAAATKKRKRRGTRGKVLGEGETPGPAQTAPKEGGRSWSRDPALAKRAKLSAQHAFERREKRQNDRTSSTTCFACRSVGHAARECPNVLLALEKGSAEGSASLLGGEDGDAAAATAEDAQGGSSKTKKGMKRKPGKKGGDVVGGKCYRCNGTDHSLHQCPKPVDPKNPTPFATCYICLGNGHLSSLCPSNPGRGVYPNGGSCKVCGSTAHRASDCPDDKRPKEDTRPRRREIVLGSGDAGGGRMGADEDDFMVDSRETMREMRDAQEAKEKSKKMKKKHAPNNNGPRAPYKAEGLLSGTKGTGEGEVDGSRVEPVAGPAEVKPSAPKPKKKVISF